MSLTQRPQAGQAWLEDIAYQMCKMSYQEQSVRLAGRVAALKYYLSHTAGEISDDAVQSERDHLSLSPVQAHDGPVFGGRGITSTGMGRLIEQFQRTYAFDKILGGSEEVRLLPSFDDRDAHIVAADSGRPGRAAGVSRSGAAFLLLVDVPVRRMKHMPRTAL